MSHLCNLFQRILPGIILFTLLGGTLQAQPPDSNNVPFGIEIGLLHDTLGQIVSVPVTKTAGSEDMYGFDFLIGFDASAMTLVNVTPGEIFDDSGAYQWEYFSFRSDTSFVYDGDTCLTTLIRAVGVAEINNGAHHPLEFNIPDGATLLTLDFLVTNDSSYQCFYSPVRFFWMDCGDNAIAMEDTLSTLLAISDRVYDIFGIDITNPNADFPSFFGAPETCVGDSNNGVVRFIDYYNGGVEITCNDSIEYIGDINLNGIAYEIADLVIFTNYFYYGREAFGDHYEASTAASDVNYDGIVLQFEDLIYLYRVVCGDAMPGYPLMNPPVPDSALFTQDIETSTVSVGYHDTLAGVFLMFYGEITPHFLLDTTAHTCGYGHDSGLTRVIITPALAGMPDSCRRGFTSGPLFTYSGDGLLIEANTADFNNHVFATRIEITGSEPPDMVLRVTIDSTTAFPGESPVYIDVYMDNPFDTVVGFTLLINLDRTDLIEFLPFTGDTIIDTTVWHYCGEWSGDTCLYWVDTTIIETWVSSGAVDTTGTLISGWNLVTSRSPSGTNHDLKVTGIANTFGGTLPGIAPQEGGLLLRLMARAYHEVPDSTAGLTARLLIIDNPSETSFSDQLGYIIGLQSEPYPHYDTATVSFIDGTVQVVSIRPGDANGDDFINIGDAVFLVKFVFTSGPAPEPEFRGDANFDGEVNIGDAVYLINYIFKSGPPPWDH